MQGHSCVEQERERLLWPWEVNRTRSALTGDWEGGRVWRETVERRGVDNVYKNRVGGKLGAEGHGEQVSLWQGSEGGSEAGGAGRLVR